MKQLMNICDYLNVTPAEFFAEEKPDSYILRELISELRKMEDEDLAILLQVARRFMQEG